MRARVLALAGVLAVCTLLTTPGVAAGSPAPSESPTASPPSSSSARGAKPARDIVSTGEGSGTDNLRIRTRVKGQPVYSGRRTVLQTKRCRSCTWHPSQSRRTNGRALVVYPVEAPATGRRFYRVKVPATQQYRTSYGNVLATSLG
jgi:hypothetical protein